MNLHQRLQNTPFARSCSGETRSPVKSVALELLHLVCHPRDFAVLKHFLILNGLISVFPLSVILFIDQLHLHGPMLPDLRGAALAVTIPYVVLHACYLAFRATFLVLRSLILNPYDFQAAVGRKVKEIIANEIFQFATGTVLLTIVCWALLER